MSHIRQIAEILSDYEWHDTAEIYRHVCGHDGGLLAIAARVCDLRKMGCDITDARDPEAMTEKRGIRRYRLNYMSEEAKLKLKLVPFPVYPQAEKEEQGLLFEVQV